MALEQRTSASEATQPGAADKHPDIDLVAGKSRWSRFFDPTIFGLFLFFAIMLPHSIKGAERAWKIALVLWLLKLAVERLRPYRLPLAAPLLTYVTLSAISTLLSSDPSLSWDRMKFVCLFLIGIVIAQNLKWLSQVRWLLMLLVLSGFSAALYTGWQYTYGVGVRLADFPSSSRLSELGFAPGDVITSFDGRRVHTPEQMVRAVQQSRSAAKTNVQYVRGLGFHESTIAATPEDFLKSGLGTESVKLDRGKPLRAQGTLGHYVVFAEMLMQIGCMAWALFLCAPRGRTGWKLLLAMAFAGITAALLATSTRASVAGLLLGCAVSLILLSSRKVRIAGIITLVVILAAGTLWIQNSRRSEWVNGGDLSTHFRVLMWEDGIRLVREHPWFGVGMETVRVHYREWNIRGFIEYNVISHFHSTFLQIAVERGIPALLAWLWFCGAYFVFLGRLIRRLHNQSRFACGVAVGVLAAFTAFTFTSLFHYNLGEEPLAMITFFYFGIALAVDRMTATPEALDVP
ncbi:MAG TPA: O-antigen ligase family protein [Candidatus Limnocylindrales bacterium]|nr:O-antigen ligase family protein [Candidatus Limnocylindrales bacterium]